ncbi:DNA methyltransferase [Nitratireductor sp. XY-223]|uniref:DNA methyltransferase n=1 Tax=Nitratireductor sp. XY-223 TaxID=2561926 RepID=UPI001981F7AB|nr:DNA methyltransferase [Nitratireductor sp. XY-223]
METTDSPTKSNLNSICPYFTMFPVEFPLGVLKEGASDSSKVLDPFCGRGTTVFAARSLGLSALGIDASPIAAAISAAKVVEVDPENVIRTAKNIVGGGKAVDTPKGEFWDWCFDTATLKELCRLRDELNRDARSPERIALRATILGALHGPKQKTVPGYFSNQAPRTYAPKPAYSVKYWKTRRMKPDRVDVIEVIARRARRFFSITPNKNGRVCHGDSRDFDTVLSAASTDEFDWIITSPPYYGMRTYIPDQWLRNWFLGGPPKVDYGRSGQITHRSPEYFAEDLRKVWRNSSYVARKDASLVVLFGGISDRRASPLEIIKLSFSGSNWEIESIEPAGNSSMGKRQADSFLVKKSKPVNEFIVRARPKPISELSYSDVIRTIHAKMTIRSAVDGDAH